jgi:hypothetical protein
MIVSQPVKKFLAFYETRCFTTVLRRAHHCSILQVKLKRNFILLFFKKVLIYSNCIKYDIVPGCRRFGEDIFDILWVFLQPGGWAGG